MLLTLLALSLPPQSPAVGETIPLQMKRHRNWAIELPQEGFRPVGQGLSLEGYFFAASVEGSNLGLDLDADQNTDVTITGKEGAALLRTKDGFLYPIRLRATNLGWEYASSGTMSGKRGTTRISLIDQDGDGRFGEVGEDAIIVGRGAVAATLSETVVIDGELLQLKASSAGDSLTLSPFEGETGRLDFVDTFSGEGRVLSAIVASADGKHVLDLAESSGTVSVPVGNYHLESAKIGMGTMAVKVSRGFAKDLEVTASNPASLTWGGPIRAEFHYDRKGGQVAFYPDAIWYYGEEGERYESWFPVGESPVFVLADADSGQEVARAMFPGSG